MKKNYKSILYKLSVIFFIISAILVCYKIYNLNTFGNIAIEENAPSEFEVSNKQEELLKDLSYYGNKKNLLTDSEIWKKNLRYDLEKSKDNEFWDMQKPCFMVNQDFSNPAIFYFSKPRELDLNEKYDDYVAKCAIYLKNNPGNRVLIYGYSDLLETNLKNVRFLSQKEISLKRANNLKEKFIKKGIDANRIKVLACEDKYPVDFDKTEPSKGNRRIMIFIYD